MLILLFRDIWRVCDTDDIVFYSVFCGIIKKIYDWRLIMKILVAIPCLNEEKNIRQVVTDILNTDLSEVSQNAFIEVLVVDDGSTDSTVDEAIAAGATVVSHTGNKGLGIAFQTAMDYAANSGADIMVNMDGDGQFNPAEIPTLIAPIVNKEADVVMGSRFKGKDTKPENMPGIKYWGNKRMSNIISKLCRDKFYDVSCGFRAYSRETILKSNFHGKYTYTQEAFIFYSTQNLKIVEVPISVRYFTDRKSRIAGSIFKYAKKTSGIIISLYSDYFPLRLYGGIAVFFLLLAIGLGIPFFYHFLQTGYFRERLAFGLTSAFCVMISSLSGAIGVILQGTTRMQENQNRILYQLKKNAK